MTEADAAELDELRAKAYGPDGELTEAEARRLDELQALAGRIMPERSAPKTADADETPTPSGDESPRNGSDASGTEDEDSSSVEDARAKAGTISEPGRFRGIRKRRWFPYVALGLALVLGFGIGFAVFGQDAVRSIALSLGVGAEQVELETAGEYDPGTIRPLEQAHDVTIWHATRDDGEEQCVVVTDEDRRQRECISTTEFEEHGGGLNGSFPLMSADETEIRGINVSIVEGADGDLEAFAQMWAPGAGDWRSQYTEHELEMIERIEHETGIDGPLLELAGYDEDLPIWVGYTGSGACIITALVDTVEQACARHPRDVESARLTIDDGEGVITTYRVNVHELRPPALTIERTPATGSDGAIDDTTGDIEP